MDEGPEAELARRHGQYCSREVGIAGTMQSSQLGADRRSRGVRELRAGQGHGEPSIFNLSSLGIGTNREEWVYGHSRDAVEKKVKLLIGNYNSEVSRLAGEEEAPRASAIGSTRTQHSRSGPIAW